MCDIPVEESRGMFVQVQGPSNQPTIVLVKESMHRYMVFRVSSRNEKKQ